MNEACNTYEKITSHMNEHTLGCHCVIRNRPCNLVLCVCDMRMCVCVCVCMCYEAYLWNLCGQSPSICRAIHIWISPYVTWLIRVCDMTHSYVWQEWGVELPALWIHRATFICVTWLIHTCTWLIHMFETRKVSYHQLLIFVGTRSYVWHDSFTCVTWHIHMCRMSALPCHQLFESIEPHSYVWHDSFIRVTESYSYVWHDSFIRVTESYLTCERVTRV